MNPFRGLAHLTFPVGDLAVAEAFYLDLLGATLVRRMDRAAFLRLRPDRAAEADADNSPLHLALRFGESPELHLFLQRALGERTLAPHPHLAIEVAGADLLPLRDRLVSAGVPVDGPRRLGPPGHASVYFSDPWSNLLEWVANDFDGSVAFGPPDLAALRPSAG